MGNDRHLIREASWNIWKAKSKFKQKVGHRIHLGLRKEVIWPNRYSFDQLRCWNQVSTTRYFNPSMYYISTQLLVGCIVYTKKWVMGRAAKAQGGKWQLSTNQVREVKKFIGIRRQVRMGSYHPELKRHEIRIAIIIVTIHWKVREIRIAVIRDAIQNGVRCDRRDKVKKSP